MRVDKTPLLIEVEKVIAGAKPSEKLIHMLEFLTDKYSKRFRPNLDTECRRYVMDMLVKNITKLWGNDPFIHFTKLIETALINWQGYERVTEYFATRTPPYCKHGIEWYECSICMHPRE